MAERQIRGPKRRRPPLPHPGASKCVAERQTRAAFKRVAWLPVLGALACCLSAQAVELKGVRSHESPEHTRVVFDASGPVRYQLMTLENPDRVVVDLQNAKLAQGFVPRIDAAKHARIKEMRAAPRGGGYRLVLDLTRPLKPQAFTLEPVPPYGHRLVIDLLDQARPDPGPQPAPATQDGWRDLVIAVDAGHGGDDPGAIGVNKVHEKQVVLSMARKLAKRFNDIPGYRAVLVRRGDYYIALRRRTSIAREARADFFVSIHADAFKSPKASGASVYALSNRGASSETARWLAEKENSSDLIGGVGNVRLDDKDPVLRQVLLDISMDANLEGSIEAGRAVLREMGKVTKLHSRTVEQAGFVVLKSPDIPSLLIETGYLSNPAEARRLNQADHQNKLVRAIHAGLRSYLESAPPPGTLFAQRLAEGKLRYTIVRGDTLSEIAMRYGTSAERIRRENGLRSDRIRVGQVILIPAKG